MKPLIIKDTFDSKERIRLSPTENLDRACLFIEELNEVGIFIDKEEAIGLRDYLTEFINTI